MGSCGSSSGLITSPPPMANSLVAHSVGSMVPAWSKVSAETLGDEPLQSCYPKLVLAKYRARCPFLLLMQFPVPSCPPEPAQLPNISAPSTAPCPVSMPPFLSSAAQSGKESSEPLLGWDGREWPKPRCVPPLNLLVGTPVGLLPLKG